MIKIIKTVVLSLSLVVLALYALAASSPIQANQKPSQEFSCTDVTEIPQIECEALVALYESTDGSNWYDNSGWLTENTPCYWLGVTCDDNHVTALNFIFYPNRYTGNNLSGAIPSEIGSLNNLSQLGLAFNELSSLPAEIGNLNNLTRLDLDKNNLSNLPAEIGNLNNLTKLYLNDNNLSDLPSEIGKLEKLTALSLGSNELITIPQVIGDLTNLTYLDLGGNRLSTLPLEIRHLSGLVALDVKSNHLTNVNAKLELFLETKDRYWDFGQTNIFTEPEIPQEQFSCADVSEVPQIECEAVVEIYGSNNGENWIYSSGWLTSNMICKWYGVTCDSGHITELELHGLIYEFRGEINMGILGLNGALPAEIGNLQNLVKLDLSMNYISSIPPEIMELDKLTYIDVSYNNYVVSQEIEDFLAERKPPVDNTPTPLPPTSTSTPVTPTPIPTDTPAPISTPMPTTVVDGFTCNNVSQIPQIECEALVALYEGMDGPNWSSGNREWLMTNQPCSWYRIICKDGHVIRLNLSGDIRILTVVGAVPQVFIFGLKGAVPAEIGNLNKLESLDFSINELSTLPAEIGDLDNLTTLDLASNQLSTLPAEIGNLDNLTTLDLASNQLSSLPPEIGNLDNLTTLDLASNQLSTLPAEIGNLDNLTILELASNQLSTLPAEIGNLDNLTILELASNQLSTLPAEIGDLDNLTQLSLYENQLSNLPPEIGNLNALTSLDLSYNQLSALPSSIGNLNNLTRLDLFINQLRSLPPEIGNLNSLTSLDLRANRLVSLPPEISNLNNLITLYLSVSNLPPEIWTLTHLTTLDLWSENLESLPPEIDNLTNLVKLDIAGNNLKTLPSEIGNLSNLTTLTAHNNQLESLPIELSHLSNLTSLSLRNNRLSILDSDLHAFIIERSSDWKSTQSLAPTDLKATVVNTDSIELTWTPILFQEHEGYYEISVADGGSFTIHGTTASKSDSRYLLDGLTSGATYDIRVRTYTSAYDEMLDGVAVGPYNKEIWSTYSPSISAMVGYKVYLPAVSR